MSNEEYFKQKVIDLEKMLKEERKQSGELLQKMILFGFGTFLVIIALAFLLLVKQENYYNAQILQERHDAVEEYIMSNE